MLGVLSTLDSRSAPRSNCYHFRSQGLKNYQPPLISFIANNESLQDNTNPLDNTNLQDHWDWRQLHGHNWLTPVTAQIASCGDCTMHAMASAYESQYKISFGLPWLTPKISIKEGFMCGGGQCSSGWSAEQVLEYGKKVGFVDHSCGEQITTYESCKQNICTDSEYRRYKIENYQAVTRGTLDVLKIRKALLHGPVLTTMGIYDDFYCYFWGVYKKMSENPPLAGHMIVIVGYDKLKKAWIVKNSWGDNWVEKGYGYIYENDTSGIGHLSWSLTLPTKVEFIEIENITDNTLVNSYFTFKLKSNSQSSSYLNLKIMKEARVVWQARCQAPECDIGLDTTRLDDSDYEIQAFTENETSKGMVKKIRILNTPPNSKQMQKLIRITRNKSLKNSYEIQFDNKFNPSKMEVRILNDNSNIIYKQITEDLSKTLTMIIDPSLKLKNPRSFQIWAQYGSASWILASEKNVNIE